MLGKPRILSLFLNSSNKFNKTWALVLDPLYTFTPEVCGDFVSFVLVL